MAILIKNTDPTIPECSTDKQAIINARTTESADIINIRATIMDFHNNVDASTNPKIKKLKKATSFPIADIFKILAANPDCKYLRVYNGFTATGDYVTYIAPITSTFKTYVESDSNSIITISCCHCNPCSDDKILNP